MQISVIIPTYNGAHKLPAILAALNRQIKQPDEVLVVVDGSTDNTVEMLMGAHYQLPGFRIIVQENKGRAGVRNRGAREAHGELLIFFDDDMRPVPDAVGQHAAHHIAFPGTILTGGQVEEITKNMPDFQRFKASLSRKWAKEVSDANTALVKDAAFLTAANFSTSKSTFIHTGGFDERLTDAEDYDLAVRASQMGIDIYFDPGIIAWHDDKVTCSSYIRRLRQYGKAQQMLAELKPELYRNGTKYQLPLPSGLKKYFFQSFCRSFWVKSVDNNRWSWLQESIRYKLYDWIVMANGTFFPKRIKV